MTRWRKWLRADAVVPGMVVHYDDTPTEFEVSTATLLEADDAPTSVLITHTYGEDRILPANYAIWIIE